MRKNLTLLLGTLFIATALPVPHAQAENYSSAAITGKVVDAESGEPLAGVNIVAQWKIDRKWVGDDKALLKVTETVSDAQGNYGFPAWGPIVLPGMADFSMGQDPGINYFKSGYWPEYAGNNISMHIEYRTPHLGEFKWNGKTIKLRKWDGKDKQYWERVDSLAGSMPDFYLGGDWKKYPRMTWAIEKENRQFRETGKFRYGIHVGGFNFDRLSKEDKEYLMRYSE